MTALIPMTHAEFDAYKEAAIAGYAADKVLSGAWAPEEAESRARSDIQKLLPLGIETPGHHLFAVVGDEAAQERVGTLWYAVEKRGGAEAAYVYDIHINAAYQRRGHATRAFLALEKLVQAQGLPGIALHVFGHNKTAQAFYETLGYRPTDIMLFKAVDPVRHPQAVL